MSQVNLSEEITLYISRDDFNKLVSEPKITESDVKFKESKSLSKILAEYGL